MIPDAGTSKSWASRITPILMASANPSTTSRRLKVLKTVGSAKITWLDFRRPVNPKSCEFFLVWVYLNNLINLIYIYIYIYKYIHIMLQYHRINLSKMNVEIQEWPYSMSLRINTIWLHHHLLLSTSLCLGLVEGANEVLPSWHVQGCFPSNATIDHGHGGRRNLEDFGRGWFFHELTSEKVNIKSLKSYATSL